MAKTKQSTRRDSKSARHVVSTSQIFKKAKKPASPKPQHLKGKTVSRKASEEGNGLTKRKRQPASQDSDLVGFNEAVEASCEIIRTECADSIKAVVNALDERLAKSNEDFIKQLESDNKVNQAVFKPLGDIEIQYNRKDGSQAGSALLSARIKQYKKTIAAEERELELLFQQYTQVNDEIIADAEKALGMSWADILIALTAGENQGSFNKGHQELTSAWEEAQTRFSDLVDKAGQHALDRLKASEKEFEIHHKRRTKELLSLLDVGI